MVYMAKNGNTGIFLLRDDQMEEHMQNGASIYAGKDIDHLKLIATPSEGFLVERPVFPVPERTQLR